MKLRDFFRFKWLKKNRDGETDRSLTLDSDKFEAEPDGINPPETRYTEEYKEFVEELESEREKTGRAIEECSEAAERVPDAAELADDAAERVCDAVEDVADTAAEVTNVADEVADTAAEVTNAADEITDAAEERVSCDEDEPSGE